MLFKKKVVVINVYLTKYVAAIIPNPIKQNSTLKTSHTMFSVKEYQNKKCYSNVNSYNDIPHM